MTIRRAVPEDLPTILTMRRERARWLAARGSDQWQVGLDEDGFRGRVEASIAGGETWMASTDQGADVGTIAVDRWTNPGLWSDAARSDSLIVHRMITALSASGRDVGRELLAHADTLAVAAGCRWLRLDAWTTNTALHRYYEAQGFAHVRTVTGHRSRSTALFERRAVCTLPSTMRPRIIGLEGLRDHAGNPIPPDHHHVIDGAELQRPQLLGPEIRTWDVMPASRWALWWDAGHWRTLPEQFGGRCANLEDSARVERWPGPELHRGSDYAIWHADDCAVNAQVADTP